MHFSALTVLACALVSVSARPIVDGAVAEVFAPVEIKNVGNDNKVAALNNVLNGGKRNVAKVVAPVTVEYVLNNNDVNVANKVANHGARNAVDVYAPVTITDILNCNNIQIANDILNSWAHQYGCTVGQLGISPEDLVNANPGNASDLLARVAAAVQNLHGRRDLVDVKAPIKAEDILNCNTIKIANDLLNHLAIELGCLVSDLGVIAWELLDAKSTHAVEAVEAKLSAAVKKVQAKGKRSAVSVYAPVTLKDILNCNTIEIANDLLNHLALELGCTVAELLLTAEEIVYAVLHGHGEDAWGSLKANIAKLPATEKRDAVSVYAPVTLKDILNCNTIAIGNDLLNHIAAELGCLVTDLLLTAEEIVYAVLHGHGEDVWGTLKANIAKLPAHEKRDAAHVEAPVDVTHVADYNMVDVLNNVANKGPKRNVADVVIPVKVKDVLNNNDVKIANWIANGKRDLATVIAPIKVEKVLDNNNVDVANWILNSKGGKRDGVDVFAPITATDIGNDNNVDILNWVLNGYHA